MNKEEAVKKIQESDNEDFQVFATQEHETYLENFAKQKVDEQLSEKVSAIHKQYDDDLYDLFGERKPTQEKTYNFMKRKFTDLKDQSTAAETYKAKVAELEEAIKNNAGDQQLKSELESVRQEYARQKEEWQQKEQEFGTKMNDYLLDTELDRAMVGFKFKDDIPEEIVETYIDKVKNELKAKAKIVDGKMIFVDEEGNTLVNKDNALNPYTPNELLSKRLDSVIAKSKKIDGPPKPDKKTVDGKDVTALPNPNAQTRAEVSQYLIANGIPNSSPEYMAMYKEFTSELPPER